MVVETEFASSNDDDDEKLLNKKDGWIQYSELNQYLYTSLLTSIGLLSSIITHPFTVIMTRQQAGHTITGDKQHVPGVIGAMKYYSKELGWRGLFRGWLPIASMGIPTQIIYLEIVESTREAFQGTLKKHLPKGTSEASIDAIQVSGSSLLANAGSLVLWVPAEVLGSRMMVQGRNGDTMKAMISRILREDGMSGFFRGFNSSLLYGVALSAQWWWSYSVCRRELSKLEVFQSQPAVLDATAGLFAGIFSTCFSHPLDTLKVRIQTNTSRDHLSMVGAFQTVVQKEGYRALMKGLSASMYQGALCSTGFALTYECVKRISSFDVK